MSSNIFTWIEVQHTIETVTSIISFFMNTFVIFLILKKSPTRFGPYKYLMIYTAVFEILYSAINLLVSPILWSFESNFLLLVNIQKSIFDKETMVILESSYTGAFGFSLALLSIHFIYRYLVAVRSELLETFENKLIILWFLFPLVLGVIWGSVIGFFCGPTEINDEYLSSTIRQTFNWTMDQVAYVGPVFFPRLRNGTAVLSISPCIGLSIMTLEWGFATFAIFYFGIKCHSHIKKMIRMLESNGDMNKAGLQSQLFYALVAQTLIPIVLMNIPIAVNFFSALIGQELGVISGILTMTISFYPIIDPLPTLFIIKPYRDAMYRYLRPKFIFKDKRSTSTTSTHPYMSNSIL